MVPGAAASVVSTMPLPMSPEPAAAAMERGSRSGSVMTTLAVVVALPSRRWMVEVSTLMASNTSTRTTSPGKDRPVPSFTIMLKSRLASVASASKSSGFTTSSTFHRDSVPDTESKEISNQLVPTRCTSVLEMAPSGSSMLTWPTTLTEFSSTSSWPLEPVPTRVTTGTSLKSVSVTVRGNVASPAESPDTTKSAVKVGSVSKSPSSTVTVTVSKPGLPLAPAAKLSLWASVTVPVGVPVTDKDTTDSMSASSMSAMTTSKVASAVSAVDSCTVKAEATATGASFVFSTDTVKVCSTGSNMSSASPDQTSMPVTVMVSSPEAGIMASSKSRDLPPAGLYTMAT